MVVTAGGRIVRSGHSDASERDAPVFRKNKPLPRQLTPLRFIQQRGYFYRASPSNPGGFPMRYGRLWLGFWLVIIASFSVLGYYGREIYRQAPPIPDRVEVDGRVLFTGHDILDGHNVWQSMRRR